MLKKIPKSIKIALLGTGAIGFAALAFRQKSKKSQTANIQKIQLSKPELVQLTIIQGSDLKKVVQQDKNQQNEMKSQPKESVESSSKESVERASIEKIETKQQVHVNQQQKSEVKPNERAQEEKKQGQRQSEKENNNKEQKKEEIPTKSASSTSQPAKQLAKKANTNLKISKLAEIPMISNFDDLQDQEYVMIVVDPGYTSMFQRELISKITRTIKRRNKSKPLSIYRIDSRNPAALSAFEQKFGIPIKQQDIYLLKNPYNSFVNFDFDNFLKHETVPSIYLSELKLALNEKDLKKQIIKMTPNETYLLLTTDCTNPDNLSKNKLMAKFLELELGAQMYDNVKICLVDHKSAQEAGIISAETPPNTLHLIRKGNQFTYKPANRWIYDDRPYHVLESISFQDKYHNILIPRYLSKIQTFTSLRINSPYICVLTIDRNRTSPKQEREILKVLGQLKESQKFPNISFVLKFGQTQFRGSDEQPFSNKKWCLKVVNAQQLDKRSFVYEMKNPEQIKNQGITQKNWLKDSFEYLFRQPQITWEGMCNFFNRVLEGKQSQYYKSQNSFKLEGVDKLSGQNFNSIVFGEQSSNTNRSHLVFQYSDHCQACQALSPIISYFANVCSQFPEIGMIFCNVGTDVHALNCDKNKVKGQPYSPYTPNLYFYSKNWKNRQPIRYPIIEFIRHTNVWGIYDFCLITDQLKKVDVSNFEQHIKNVSDKKVRVTDF